VPAVQPGQGWLNAVKVVARAWQAVFLARHPATTDRDFLLVATPGAGQDAGRPAIAARAAGCEQLFVVCPTTALRFQWADAADRVGLHLDPRWRNADGALQADVDGAAVTVAAAPDLFAHHLVRPTLVVLDEIHHAGDPGPGCTRCGRRSATRGGGSRCPAHPFASTPARSRSSPTRRGPALAPDVVCGIGEAVADAVCRPLAFRLLDGTLHWRVDAQKTIAAFTDELDPQDDARRLRTALDPATPLLPGCCATPTLLVKARSVIMDAAALVLCDDRAHARATAALLRTVAGTKPVVVVSDEVGAPSMDDGPLLRAAAGGRRGLPARRAVPAHPARRRRLDVRGDRPLAAGMRTHGAAVVGLGIACVVFGVTALR
jgi:hypothetical protein